MNKYQLIGILFALTIAVYGITSIYADPMETPTDNTEHGHHYQRGDMDGTHDQIHARDGSGIGGMYGYGDGMYNNGTCPNE